MFIAASCLAVYFGERKRYSFAFVGGMNSGTSAPAPSPGAIGNG